MGTNTDLYEQDFFQWTQTTADLIRQGKWGQIDPRCLAEELEGLGKRDLRELEDRLSTLLYDLLKWWAQPEERCGRWASAISHQRYELELILRDSPSLQTQLSMILKEDYSTAQQKVRQDTGLFKLPEKCPFTLTQVLAKDFWPEGSALVQTDASA
ncbi:MAG: hypothetical protein ETSY1_18325 [Candidatus Entotheonella factor]|uniref:DUF29 domain-containing protein n=1 Tax=Entotheonella factor TaxID=1429438 RepID=W4LLE8_ENTF1|nr:DUF29 domain-containing protein [Candidatus Entotheonella palauensis]ETW98545.1 MAG: hypothetical protein ETSY1_18325 [Candidatus Entotheonella factor]